MLEVADIFRRYGEAYLEKYGAKLPPRHRRAFQDILHCRTPALGGHLYACDHCGHQVYSYHSCRNRSCPKCHGDDTEAWLEKRRKELLPVEYFHVVFTLPQELRHPVRSHPEILYGILMKAAAQSLIKLAADPQDSRGSLEARVGRLLQTDFPGRRQRFGVPRSLCASDRYRQQPDPVDRGRQSHLSLPEVR